METKLQVLNWAAAFAHFASLVLLIVAYVHWKGSKHADIVLYRYQIEGPTTTSADKTTSESAPRHLIGRYLDLFLLTP